MATFPAAGTFEVPSDRTTFTVYDFADAQEAFLASCKQLPGGAAVSELTISGGIIVPTSGAHTVDTELDALADELTNIQYTNLPDGRLLILWLEDSTRVVTLKHMAGGIGQIYLAGAADYEMSYRRPIVLQRIGSLWVEVIHGAYTDRDDDQDAQLNRVEWALRALVGDADGVFAYGTVGKGSLGVTATSPASMQVTVSEGGALIDGVLFVYETTTTLAAFVAPTTHPRIDIIVANRTTQTVYVRTGAEAASPSAPALATGEMTLAEVYHRVGETAIYDADTSGEGYLTDRRSFANA